MRASVQKALFVAVVGLVMLMQAPSTASAQINPRIVREVRHDREGVRPGPEGGEGERPVRPDPLAVHLGVGEPAVVRP